jgi:DNA-directed RNA polymerase II subunit RPB1
MKTVRKRAPLKSKVKKTEDFIDNEDDFIQQDITESFPITTLDVSKVVSSNITSNQPIRLSKSQQDRERSDHAERMSKEIQLIATGSQLKIYSSEDIVKLSYGESGKIENLDQSGPGSINDPLMGPINLNTTCLRCGLIDCPGHFGRIEFGKGNYIYHPAYIRSIVYILSSVCNSCSKLLISDETYEEKGFSNMGNSLLQELSKLCTTVRCLKKSSCDRGGEIKPCLQNPKYKPAHVKEQGQIVYESPKKKKSKEGDMISDESLLDDEEQQPELYKCTPGCNNEKINTPMVRLKPITEVLKILRGISDSDVEKLGFVLPNRPENMVLNMILVLPNIARPPVTDGNGNVKDDSIVQKYRTLIRRVKELDTKGSVALHKIYCCYMELLFKAKDAKVGVPGDYKAIIDYIQGKEAIPRKNLMGKRVNYCGRTVGGPGSSLNFGQVGTPDVWKNILTKKLFITSFNINAVNKMLTDGKITHIVDTKTKISRFYNPNNTKIPYEIKIGDYVNKYLEDDDYILCNRQPTLHKHSMMGFQVSLGKFKTIRHHLSATSPMNLDFDGDECNDWIPRNLNVEAEVRHLFNITKNITSSENNKPIMGLVMNSITGSYLLSDHESLVDEKLMEELTGLLHNRESLPTLRSRLLKYRINPMSRAAVFSMLLPGTFYYHQKGVTILEGILVNGRLTKGSVGATHRSIIQELWKDFGDERTKDFFTDATIIINKWIIEYGFTVGISDVINLSNDIEDGNVEYDINDRLLQRKLRKIYLKIAALGGKSDNPVEEEYREQRTIELLDVARTIGIVIANKLPDDNAIKIMTDQGAGTKGSATNIGAIMGAIGQQYYHAKRLEASLSGGTRLLPTYDENDDSPEAHGFIPESFFAGVTPQGLFYLQAGGREGLLDTNLKTAETGALQRLIFKTVESIIIDEDGSVRNTSGTLFSLMYNSGYDISETVEINNANNEKIASFIDIKSTMRRLNNERGWYQSNVVDKIEQREILEDPPKIQAPKEYATVDDINEGIEFEREKLTKFEKVRLIGARATQFANGVKPLTNTKGLIDLVDVAEKEYSEGIIPIYIIRKFPDGRIVKFYPTKEHII